MGALDAPVQGASFYVEKIKLASELRESYTRNGVGVGHFQAKVPSHIFRHQPIKFHYLQVQTL